MFNCYTFILSSLILFANKIIIPVMSHTDFLWKTRDRHRTCARRGDWAFSASFRGPLESHTLILKYCFCYYYYFCIFPKVYGVCWGKGALKGLGNSMCSGKRIILQDPCGDEILGVPVEFELLHFSHFPNQDHWETTARLYAGSAPETNTWVSSIWVCSWTLWWCNGCFTWSTSTVLSLIFFLCIV